MPESGAELPTGVRELRDHSGLPVWSKAVLMPFTLAVDLVTLPAVLIVVAVGA